MKRLFIALLAIFSFSLDLSAQDVQQEQPKAESFVSNAGEMTHFQDYFLLTLKPSKNKLEWKDSYIRKLTTNGESTYFYRIGSNGDVSIIYSELIEITKALKVLQSKEASDIASKPDYLENKFKTTSGIEVGYFIKSYSNVDTVYAHWYISQGSDIIRLSKDDIGSAFAEAIDKMKSLVAE